ncbi:site-specific DNA-methyltransferase [Verrucosispora sp. WMMA2044]|uniref:site-specific DNA-methyltransferase n=1 Tax=Verrucosispora sp. WMMA2044 TaxID=3016419 RepID=UPI00248D1A83|nr:site-specific DNA-methyltransferase [Verrucosispora sp. WMMA2044]WBB50941.1 site-specific DNA-methyltransferase [Verrucosispora sp. WMMA2044]
MPPRSRKPAVSTVPVQAIAHPTDRRVHIPTADGQEFVSPDAARIEQVKKERDPSLDPQLVWIGKEDQDAEDLVVEAPPIYIQEKIAPRTLVEELRRASEESRPRDNEQLGLFADDYADFDGLDDWQSVEYYQHEANWSNRMILGDSLRVMASLAEKERLRGKVQMIYIDPPYGIKFGSNWQMSARKRDVKDGNLADVTREVEQIKAFRDTWELGINSYLAYLRDRLIIARDLLTESGSIFVQIGDENVHMVRCLLDEVFGPENFVSLISFVTTSGFDSSTLARAGDYVVWYARSANQAKVRRVWQEADRNPGGSYRWLMLPDGHYRSMTSAELAGSAPLPPEAKLYAPDNLQSQNPAGVDQPFEYQGKTYRPMATSHWKANYPDGMNRLKWAGRIHAAKNSLRYVRYAEDFPLRSINNMWTDTGTGNFTDDKVYVVQTNTKVVERCMLMCSDPGDLVLDPTCGSGTTAYVAEQWGRRWITIDTSRVAITLARQRVIGARYPAYLLADSTAGRAKERELSGAEVPPTPPGHDIRKGFVYERVPHVTLKSIANNPDIKEGMSRKEIDTAIRRHAETELLYDRPYEDKKRIRVAGRFTVESLSPHRPATFSIGEEHATGTDVNAYVKTILDNLAKAGVQNGWRNERLEFVSLNPYPGKFVHAEAARRNDDEGTSARVAVSVGPQYGTVDADWVKDAAREALKGVGFDLLLVCAFGFDGRAIDAAGEFSPEGNDFATVAEQRQLGRLPILLVRMNADLAMGDTLLKKTGTANLFTVFGEPDIAIDPAPDGLVVEIRGVDVYNPTTGELRPDNGVADIALWMIDTDYNEEEFFVRHIYFAGKDGKPDGLDPYSRLHKALRAQIDESAWESLYGHRSRPFPRPGSGKIAVKVVNHYGDEVVKVYEV